MLTLSQKKKMIERIAIFIKNNYKYYIIFIRMIEFLSHKKEKKILESEIRSLQKVRIIAKY